MPSPVADRPGLLIRDPMLYSDQVLLFPPPLVLVLALFDGDQHEQVVFLQHVLGPDVRSRDEARNEKALVGDPAGFWRLVRGQDGEGDELRLRGDCVREEPRTGEPLIRPGGRTG